MRYLLHLGILLLLCGSAASVSLAQVQITPTPLPQTPLFSGNAITCSNNCDIAAMSCQNSCLTAPPALPQTPLIGTVPLRPPAQRVDRACLVALLSSSSARQGATERRRSSGLRLWEAAQDAKEKPSGGEPSG